jgi:hypothetical protein
MSFTAGEFDELQANYEVDRVKRFLEGIRKELRI